MIKEWLAKKSFSLPTNLKNKINSLKSLFKNWKKTKQYISLFLLLIGLISGYWLVNKVKSLDIRKKASGRKVIQISTSSDFLIPLKNIKEINIDQSISTNTEFRPFDRKSKLASLGISAQVSFENPDKPGAVRVVLLDQVGNEYLVYETHSQLTVENNFDVDNICQETCLLDYVSPDLLRLEIRHATINLKTISYSEDISSYKKQKLAPKGTTSLSKLEKLSLQDEKNLLQDRQTQLIVDNLNEFNSKKGLKWKAGMTDIAKLSYAQKKRLFSDPDVNPSGEMPFLNGAEYYVGGVLELNSNKKTNERAVREKNSSSSLPDGWDWRNVHGQNWLTSVKHQGLAGTCMMFTTIGSLEAAINLHYNQHIDPDLSEQMIADCVNSSNRIPEIQSRYDFCRNRYQSNPLYCPTRMCTLMSPSGVADESCDPYVERGIMHPGEDFCNYDYICQDWQERSWTIGDLYFDFYDGRINRIWCADCGSSNLYTTEEELKQSLVYNGPAASVVKSWFHAMVFVGYETDSQDGGTIWIFKNSWGKNWGEAGYARIKTPLDDVQYAGYPKPPFTPPTGLSYEIVCTDNDSDGYCNWGLSQTKPASCPSNCQDFPDLDDSDPSSGPLPAFEPLPTPIPNEVIISNAATNKTCDQLCQEFGGNCISAGLDGRAMNTRQYRRYTCDVIFGACDSVMWSDPQGLECNGKKASWTNCSCVGISPSSTPTPTLIPTFTPTPTSAPISTPTPTPTPTEVGYQIILNSATGKSCNEICGDAGLTCTSAGWDSDALNGKAHLFFNQKCYDYTIPPGQNCTTKMMSLFKTCSGHETSWTNCRCETSP
jgi:C1A family cysteine protease